MSRKSGGYYRQVVSCVVWVMAIVLLTGFSTVAFGQASSIGQYSPQQSLPYKAVHAHFMPTTGQVMFSPSFGAGDNFSFWNPATGEITSAADATFNPFCGGHSFMSDGRLFWTGGLGTGTGDGVPNAAIFDPVANTWTNLPNMNEGRWYPTTTTLPNGDILTISGEIDPKNGDDPLPQIWDFPSQSWINLTTASMVIPVYPRMLVAPNGNVFQAGPGPATRYLKTSGTGSWVGVGKTNFTAYRDYGSAVMYAVGKVLIMGGSEPPTATAETIDLNPAKPVWVNTSPMNYPRRQLNATILADGTVFVSGGSSGDAFDDSSSPVLPSEIWNPSTGAWTVVASLSVYRGYHSTALLLPDGRVFSGGGEVSPLTYEIYSPPYLFQGPQPVIASAPTSVTYGQKFFVATPNSKQITAVNWIGVSSVTHAFNMNQRLVNLSFKAGYSGTTQGLNVTAPSSGNVAPPGYYMLFILQNGVPSVAAIVQIGPSSDGTKSTK